MRALGLEFGLHVCLCFLALELAFFGVWSTELGVSNLRFGDFELQGLQYYGMWRQGSVQTWRVTKRKR